MINQSVMSHVVYIMLALAFSRVMVPVQKRIYEKVTRKWLAYIVTFMVGAPILFASYFCAYMIFEDK